MNTLKQFPKDNFANIVVRNIFDDATRVKAHVYVPLLGLGFIGLARAQQR